MAIRNDLISKCVSYSLADGPLSSGSLFRQCGGLGLENVANSSTGFLSTLFANGSIRRFLLLSLSLAARRRIFVSCLVSCSQLPSRWNVVGFRLSAHISADCFRVLQAVLAVTANVQDEPAVAKIRAGN
jgi:hypothetical protein